MVTRRQFGFWTAAAMMATPAVSIAGQPKRAPDGDDGLASLDFTGKLAEESDSAFAIDLQAVSAAKKGMTVRMYVVKATVEFGDEPVEDVMAWMNNDHPMSRRKRPPSFIDIPPEKPTMAGTVNLYVNDEWKDKPGGVLNIVLGVRDDKDGMREVALPPIALTEKKEKNS